MVLLWLFNMVHTFLLYENAHAFDLHLDTQNYLAMGLAFLFSTNQFFPITDGYIPIFLLWVTIYSFLGIMKGFEIGFNAIRGAGLRL